MTLPESLPARLYLLAYDTKEEPRHRAVPSSAWCCGPLRSSDLYLAGRVTDENGKVRVDRRSGRPTGDPPARRGAPAARRAAAALVAAAGSPTASPRSVPFARSSKPG